MNDNFGNISQDFLPPGYGDIPSKVIQRVGMPVPGSDAPTLEPMRNQDDYDGIFDIFRRKDAAVEAAGEIQAAEAVEAGGTDKQAFFANLGTNVSSLFQPVGAGTGTTKEQLKNDSTGTSQRAERGAAIGAGIGAAAAQLLPILASMLGPQEITPLDDEFVDVTQTPKGPNWGIIVGGVALVGLVGGVLFMALRDDDDRR